MSEYYIIGHVTLGVEDTGDGLIIDAEDAKKWNLLDDFDYQGNFQTDGSYRIAIPLAATLPPKITGGRVI